MPETRVGLDLCKVARMEPLLENERFLEKYFTAGEAAYIRGRGVSAAQTMAGIWAAKEALLKALGTGLSLPLREVAVTHDALGAPSYALTGKAAEAAADASLSLSVTHEDGMAAAVCVLVRP